MRTFLLKAKHFIKRNIYPITVSLCTVLVLSIITISAYSSISSTQSGGTQLDQTVNVDKPITEDESIKPTGSPSAIIFDVPFENAAISKEYTDSSLLYDETTKLWCTHQGLDFACVEGQEIKAVYDGTIVKVENSMMNGTVVYLKVSEELTVVYKGLASELSINEGDSIKKGEVIGKATSFLAEKADGVHLHLELLKTDKLADPTEYFSFNK